MTRWMRKLHKWTGLILAVQFVLWMGSGLVMSLLDHDKVQGHHYRAVAASKPAQWPTGTLAPSHVLSRATLPARSLEAMWLRERPVYRLARGEDTWLVDARNGAPVAVDSATALVIAVADYTGPGRPGTPVSMENPTLEARNHPAPIWRIAFDDDDGTTLYVSGQDGRILARRNDTWRLFDIAWMLHIMDYTNRDDFNNPLVVTTAAGGLWIALTGVWLLIAFSGIFRVDIFGFFSSRRSIILSDGSPGFSTTASHFLSGDANTWLSTSNCWTSVVVTERGIKSAFSHNSSPRPSLKLFCHGRYLSFAIVTEWGPASAFVLAEVFGLIVCPSTCTEAPSGELRN